MAGRFELKKSGGKFLFNLMAANGRVVLTSERYSSKAGALNGIKSVMKNAARTACFETRTARNDKPYFVLRAQNGEVIGRSQMYASASGKNNGIQSVLKCAPRGTVDDLC